MWLWSTAAAQVNAPVNGVAHPRGRTTAFVHATLHPSPGETVNDGTLLIRDDRVVAIGTRVTIPATAVVIDLHGLHVWPGLVEPYSELGLPRGERGKEMKPTGARFWNPAIRASTDGARLFVRDEEAEANLRAQGYTTIITHRQDGIARGTGCAVVPAGRSLNEDIIAPATAAHFSFRKGSSNEDYPSSLMGSIALLRQSWYDARWYAGQGRSEQSDVELDALAAQLGGRIVLEAGNRNDVLRIAALGHEFGLRPVVKGVGDEYARLGDIKATGLPLIIPIRLPDVHDVEDPFDALEVDLAQMKHWELAPTNAVRLADVDIDFAFTQSGLKEPGAMWSALRRMVRSGLDTVDAIAALTTTPARLYGLEERVGALRPGMLAGFIITSHHLLYSENTIHETWVAGERFVQQPPPGEDPRGGFDLNFGGRTVNLSVKGEAVKPEATIALSEGDTVNTKADLSIAHEIVTLVFDGTRFGHNGPVRLNGAVHPRGGIWDGQGQLPGGGWTAWSAVRKSGPKARTPKDKKNGALDSLWAAPTGVVWYPLSGYGLPMLPDTEHVVFRHATVWTNGPQGILRDADVCISGGRIKGVGQGLDINALFNGRRPSGLVEIDAEGKHLTCGIIDEHSHIAIERGVNEGSQAITAEVRIGDVIDPDDVDIYRDLAGGVTTIQQLHGSSNPIGGQSALTKLRWGRNAEQMRIAGADGYIKFALGENVKQSNWNADGSRFPQTRMGVEQLMYDAFHRAKRYRSEIGEASTARPAQAKKRRKRTKVVAPASPPQHRRDLELEALAEIVDEKRFISCHSYVQSEINMLMNVADSMGFKVQTFTHILEGYKVAQRLKEHGATASTFSDWWAYKMEVADAIPYNAALLQAQGVNVCINSDDAEMSRRLNQEAAKTMKYGGVSAEEAWKMVTLNPAKALRLDGRMGSVETGKDADIVLWNADPLTVGAKAELTFVDGVRYFDRKKDAEQRAVLLAERERLVAKMIVAKKAGATTRKTERKEKRHWECETIGEEP